MKNETRPGQESRNRGDKNKTLLRVFATPFQTAPQFFFSQPLFTTMRIQHLRAAVSVLTFVAVAALVPGRAFGQTALTALTPPNGVITQFRSGAFAVVPTFELLSIGTDSNVFNAAGARDADIVTSVRPGVEIGLRQERMTLVVRPRVGYVYYSRHEAERAINPQLELGLERRFSKRFALFGGGAAGWSKERDGLEVDTRARVFDDNVILGSRVTGRRMRFELSGSSAARTYDRSATFFGESLAAALDRRSTGAAAEVAYELTPKVALTFKATGTVDRFRNLAVRDMNRWTTLGGVDFGRRALVRGRAAIGYESATPLHDDVQPFRGVIGNAGLGWTWHDRIDVSAGADRSLDYSYQSSRSYYLRNEAEAGVRAAIRARLDIGVRGSYGLLDYASPVDGTAQYQERLRELTGTLGVRLRHGLRVGMYVSQWERYTGLHPYRSMRTGVEFSVGKLNVNSRGVMVSGPGR
jgi:hypothetical protein